MPPVPVRLDWKTAAFFNGTPGVKDDDILVIANNFWDRFALVPTVIE